MIYSPNQEMPKNAASIDSICWGGGKKVKHHKYIGVWIDEKLSWSPHIEIAHMAIKATTLRYGYPTNTVQCSYKTI